MKKIIALVLALILSFSVLSVSSFAADAAGITSFSIKNITDSENDADIVVNWFASNSKYYLFVPAAMSLDEAVIDFAAFADVYCGETKLTDGDSAAFLKDKQQVTLTCDGASYDVVIFSESKVASVFIETESGSLDAVHADKEHKEKGKITIINTDGETECAGLLDYIKGRGNSTWGMPKKPYNIKLEEKENLFGMGKSKKWSLIANYADTSLLRNSLAYLAAENAGVPYTPKFTPVDVYINGNYEGAYLLTTRVEVDKTRVNIQNLEDENEEANPDVDIEALPRGGVYGSTSGYLENTKKWIEIPNNPKDITGGYIIETELPSRYDEEISGFVTENSQAIILKSPEYASKEQIEYISGWYQNFENAVYGNKGLAEIAKYCNVESLVDVYLLNEWYANHDAGLTSTYLYKPVNDTLYAGPVWDYDRAFGNCDRIRFGIDYNKPEQWTVCHSRLYGVTILGAGDTSDIPTFYNHITKNQQFIDMCKEKWNGVIKSAVGEAAEYITTEYAENAEGSAVANAIRWNTYGTSDIAEIKTKYAADVKKVADFAQAKADYITANIGVIAEREVETDFEDKFNIFFSNVLEKLVRIFRLENLI